MKRVHFVLLLILSAGFISPPNVVRLEYVFEVGDEYTMTQVTKQTIKQTIMGTDQNGENMYSGEMKFKVIAISSSGAKLETQFLSLKNSSKTIMGAVTMDSESAEESAANKVFKSVMKKSFFITMNKAGRVENVEGTENLWSDIGTLGIDENTMTTLRQSLDQLFSKSSLKNSIEQGMVYYADKKVKQGDTWNSKNAFPMDFPIQVDNSWSLVSLTKTTAKVNADGVYTTTDKEKTVNLPNGMSAKVDMNGTQAMKSNVNVKTGWPSDLHIVSVLKGRMILLAGGILPQDMEMPMEILTETAYKIVKR